MELDVGLTLADVITVMAGESAVSLSGAARRRVADNRAYVESLVAAGKTVYGVTTGFGRFATTAIAAGDVEELQHNLLRSHAIGVGTPVPADLVRAMLLLRAQSLALGASGVRPELIDALLAMLNAGVVPVVP